MTPKKELNQGNVKGATAAKWEVDEGQVFYRDKGRRQEDQYPNHEEIDRPNHEGRRHRLAKRAASDEVETDPKQDDDPNPRRHAAGIGEGRGKTDVKGQNGE